MRRFIIILVVLITSSSFAQSDNAPILYYYDFGEAGWVIERADGTDRSVFGTDITLSEEHAIRAIGWSPSGEWLAWTSQYIDPRENFTNDSPTPYVASRDGQTLDALSEFTSATTAWSPINDWLFVVGYIGEPLHVITDNSEMNTLRMALYDMTTMEIPWQEDYLAAIGTPLILDIVWSPDGRYAITHVLDYTAASDTNSTRMFSILDTATMTENPLPLWCCPEIQPSGWYIYPQYATVEHLFTGATFHDLIYADVRYSKWSDDGLSAILWDGETTWLLAIDDERIVPLQTIIVQEVYWPSNDYPPMILDSLDSLYTLDDNHSPILIAEHVNWYGTGWQTPDHFVFSTPSTIYEYHWEYQLYDATQGEVVAYLDERYPVTFSEDGLYAAYIDRHPNDSVGQLVVHIFDLILGQTVWLDSHAYRNMVEPHDYDASFFWHGDWLIIEERPFVAMMGSDPILYSVAMADGSGRRDLTTCRVAGCVGWLD